MKTFNFTKFGRDIRENRQSIDLNNSLREVAPQIGISHSSLSRAENGNNIDVNTLLNISSFYGLDMEDLGTYYVDEG